MVSLISGLLKKDKNHRLGAVGDSEEIMKHPYFAKLDIEKLLKREVEAPFIPELGKDDEANPKYFNVKTGEELSESIIPKANMKAIRENQDQFADFQQKTPAYRK